MPTNSVQPELRKSYPQNIKARKLVRRIESGDKSAEGEAYEFYAPRLTHIIKRYTNCLDQLNDALNSTWLIAIPKLRKGELKNPDVLGSYLCGIAKNVALGELRKCPWLLFNADSCQIEQTLVDVDDPETKLSRTEDVLQTLALVSNLTVQRDRDVIEACCIRDLDKHEICKTLDLDRVQLSRVLSRARKRLRTQARVQCCATTA